MSCLIPNPAKWGNVNPKSGKCQVVVMKNTPLNHEQKDLEVPCGRCIACRLEYSRQWAMKCVHESKQWTQNCMITLTYDPEHLPPGGTLVKKHFQDFMKRLQSYVYRRGKRSNPELSKTKLGRKQLRQMCRIRRFPCGEYGEKLGRPHYHSCIFNYDFDDKVLDYRDGENLYYRSKTLAKLWGKGREQVTELNFKTAAYVARYITKKVNGPHALYTYDSGQVDPSTGECIMLEKEFSSLMSRRPGIGKTWWDKNKGDVLLSVVMNGREVKPPKSYDKYFEAEDPRLFEKIKELRLELAEKNELNNTPERREVRLRKKELDAKKLKRSYENGT